MCSSIYPFIHPSVYPSIPISVHPSIQWLFIRCSVSSRHCAQSTLAALQKQMLFTAHCSYLSIAQEAQSPSLSPSPKITHRRANSSIIRSSEEARIKGCLHWQLHIILPLLPSIFLMETEHLFPKYLLTSFHVPSQMKAPCQRYSFWTCGFPVAPGGTVVSGGKCLSSWPPRA